MTGHDLWRRHRLGHREPGLAGNQWLGLRDSGGKHRFRRQQLRAHRRPLRTLPGEHPHRSPVVLPSRGLIRSIAVGDLPQCLGELRLTARNDGGAYWAVRAPTRQGVGQVRQHHVVMCLHPVGQPAGGATQFVGRGGRQRKQLRTRRRRIDFPVVLCIGVGGLGSLFQNGVGVGSREPVRRRRRPPGRVTVGGPRRELAVRKTSDDDMAGLDLSDVLVITTGSERVHPATLRRFTQRFARFNLRDAVIRPSYGLAEATVYVATRAAAQPPVIVRFDSEKLTAGKAERCESGGGTPLVSYGMPRSPMIRIVDPETRIECPAGTIGEIWVHGDNVAMGYWRKPHETESTFGGRLVAPSAGIPEGPWLRTGDSGFFFDDELFIIGRIKDLLIVYGRNHSPDDIEATIQEITGGRCAAIAVPDEGTEQLVVIIEVKKRGESHEEVADKLTAVKREVTSAISNSHGLSIADLVLVPPGSIPITTSGKVRRAACVEQYRHGQFARLDP